MIKVGIFGSTGYTGQELVRLLLQHPECEISHITSYSHIDKYSSIFGNYVNILEDKCTEKSIEELSKLVDVLFIATPHGIASKHVNKKVLANTKIIDLSGDYRLTDVNIYEKWYDVEHSSKELLDEAVYGLCELKRNAVKGSSLVANLGCYTTCSILTLYPLIKEKMIDLGSIVVDAKSGVSGAGRSPNLVAHYPECNENIKAYSLACHKHTPEIEQELSIINGDDIKITFTPHLVPMSRGILVVAYGKLVDEYSYEDIKKVYEKYYKDEFFIRLLEKGIYPETKWVRGSNYCDINFTVDKRTNRIIAIGAIDNLLKGAAGQAVQNMNIMFNLNESLGLNLIPTFPA